MLLINSILAALMIIIGCVVYLQVGGIFGAILFSFALLTICSRGYHLYTGRVGLVSISTGIKIWEKFLYCTVILLLNFVFTYLFGTFIRNAGIGVEVAQQMCAAKLAKSALETFVDGFLCGVIMYVAVQIFLENKSVFGILIGVPVFIMSGFEHSIADMGYLSIAGYWKQDKVVPFILLVIAGNTLGSIFVALGESIVYGLLKTYGQDDAGSEDSDQY